jgi:CHAT domain-containing protein/tetratricopeptide (TPR) repeat protein
MVRIKLIMVLAVCLGFTAGASAQQAQWDELNRQVVKLYQNGRYADAIPIAERALEVAAKTIGPNDPRVATALNNLAELYRVQGKYSDAEPLYKRSLEITEKALGKNHPHVAYSLNNLALLYQAQGKYSEAEPLYQRSLAIKGKALGKDHPDVATSLNNLAELYRVQGKYSKAEPLYKRSLAIREKALGKDHPNLAQSLNNLAALYQAQGKYSDAEPLYQRSLAIREKALGKAHPDLAQSLNNLASLYHAQGKYSEAEPLYERSLAIREKALGKDHPHVAISLNNLAELYRAQGKYIEAEPFFKRSLGIWEKALGKDHPHVATALENLGVLNQDRGNYPEALRMFQESLDIRRRKGLPLDEPQNLIANLYLDLGQVTSADPIVAQAGWSTTRARLCLMKKDFKGAKGYYERIRVFAEQNRNANNLFIAYTGLGMSWEGLADDTRAADSYRKAVDFMEDLRSSLARSDRERFFDAKVYGMSRTAPYEGLARVLMKLKKPVDALKESEYTKARVYAEWLSRRSEGTTSRVPKDVLGKDSQLNDQLAALSKRLQEAYGKADKEAIPVLEPQVKEAKQKLADHVDMLRRQFPLFAAIKYPQPMSLDQTALKDNEWVLAYHVTDSGIIIYLTQGKHLVKGVFKPFPRKELDGLVRKFLKPMELGSKNSLSKKLVAFDFKSGKKLSDLLLADILSDLPKDTPVIIVPDASLGVVPFEMLVMNDGGKVITDDKRPQTSGAEFFGDRSPISYYQSITALTLARRLGKQQKPGEKLLAMVDPVFSSDDPRLVKLAKQEKDRILASLPQDKIMSIETESGLAFPRLPLTAQLGESLKKAEPQQTDLYEGISAKKSVLLENDLTPYRSLVFGTHGYFGKDLPGIQEPVLVLSLLDQPKGQDGFLRLSEVMGLKINCDIAVLTACQTGLGRHISGEGTMGMGRAFQYAGAKSVLMSLWSVSETASVNLVESFFKHVKEGKSKLQALRLARDEIRKAGYDHPFYWAPFILVGEQN